MMNEQYTFKFHDFIGKSLFEEEIKYTKMKISAQRNISGKLDACSLPRLTTSRLL